MRAAEFPRDDEEFQRNSVDLEGIEKLTLTSVGIDIGSSTSHLLFSRLTLRRKGAGHSAKFKVASREILWSSPILLTPYLSQTRIDFFHVRDFMDRCYRDAGLNNGDIDTGAVVITGEALKKENARPIIEYFAQESGKFICASAGPHHEALLAAYGSGAVQISRERNCRILNVDMGGGTTKLSLIAHGEILQTAAINIGARLIAAGREGEITRIEDAGALLAREAGVAAALGDLLDVNKRARIGELMGRTLIDLLCRGTKSGDLARRLMVTSPLEAYDGLSSIDYIIFSGGVSEYVYDRTSQDFGDLGPVLGRTIRNFIDSCPAGMLLAPADGIRATVIGASEYTIQVSGATSFYTSAEALPLSGFKVIHVHFRAGEFFASALESAFRKFDVAQYGLGYVIALSVHRDLDYPLLRELALGLYAVADPSCALIVIVEQDIARALGSILKYELGLPGALICIDSITVGDLDYIDIGKPMSVMDVFPVTVKSLLFSSERAL